MAAANEAEIDMKYKPMSFVSKCGNHARMLAPAAALLLLSGFAWSQDNQAGSSFDEEMAHIAQALELSAGLTVADVGAGTGRHTVFLAEAVTSTGTVYATEVDEGLLTDIRQAVGARENVTVILGKQDSTELPDQCCDRILLRRVYHHFEEPRAMLASLRASLKPGGMIAVVDFLRKSSDLGRPDATPQDHEHGVRIDSLTEQMEKAGFELVRQVEDWPSRVRHGRETDFCVVFRRPD